MGEEFLSVGTREFEEFFWEGEGRINVRFYERDAASLYNSSSL